MTTQWVFIRGFDSIGHDIGPRVDKLSVDNVARIYGERARAFNTLGFAKTHVVLPLVRSAYYGPNDGIYIDASIIPERAIQETYDIFSLTVDEKDEKEDVKL